MHNISYKFADGKLVVEIDVSERAVSAAPPSSTGKTVLVASSSGYMDLNQVASGKKLSLSLNLSAK